MWKDIKENGEIIIIANYLSKDGLMALYYSCVYPYFMYCDHIWVSTYETNLRPLVILPNKVVHIISHVKPRNGTGPLYKALNIMQFEDFNNI